MKTYNKISLTLTPTPLHRMSQMEKLVQGPPLFVKRDDLLGRILGGHKLRKLEYIIPVALSDNADILVTVGAVDSNHACFTAFFAKMLGLRAIIFLISKQGKRLHYNQREVALNDIMTSKLGAELRFVEEILDDTEDKAGLVSETTEKQIREQIDILFTELQEKGHHPFYIPPGGCCLAGCYAMIEAFDELHAQMISQGVDSYDIFIPVGTGATYAGLWAGVQKRQCDVRIYGISCAASNPTCREIVTNATIELCNDIGLSLPDSQQLNIIDDFVGEGYGQPTEVSKEAIDVAFRSEGLLLDHTYTGKSFGGLLTLVRRHKSEFKRPIVFWHTGGIPEGIGDILEVFFNQGK